MSEQKASGKDLLLLLAFFPLEVIWSGLVLTKLWMWFVVPIFAIRNLRIPEAIGLNILTHYLTLHSSVAQEKRSTLKTIAFGLVLPLLALFSGWIVHLYL